MSKKLPSKSKLNGISREAGGADGGAGRQARHAAAGRGSGASPSRAGAGFAELPSLASRPPADLRGRRLWRPARRGAAAPAASSLIERKSILLASAADSSW